MSLLFAIESFMNDWAEDIVLEICLLAKESGHSVFNHLTKDNEFRKNHKLIDNAVTFIRQIRAGTFLTMHGPLFAALPGHVLEARRVDFVTKRVKQLKGSKEGIRGLLVRCAKNYFAALSPGMDIPEYLKKYYPKTVEHFLLEDNGMGSAKAHFMMFYFPPDSAKQQALENSMARMREKSAQVYEMAAGFAGKISNYDDDVKVREGYWANISRLFKEFERLRAENKTSYTIPSCFDFVFRQADRLHGHFGAAYKGYFDMGSQTVARAIEEIRNR